MNRNETEVEVQTWEHKGSRPEFRITNYAHAVRMFEAGDYYKIKVIDTSWDTILLDGGA